MNVKTLTKIGAVTLASCSAHAALLAALPAHDPSARIKGGSVSVQFASVGNRTGEGRSASPPENADANTAVEPLVEGETVEPEPSGAELTSAEPEPMKEVAEVSAPEAIPKTPPPSYTPATEVHPETLPKDLLATPPERSHESEKPVSPDDAETSQHAMPDGKTADRVRRAVRPGFSAGQAGQPAVGLAQQRENSERANLCPLRPRLGSSDSGFETTGSARFDSRYLDRRVRTTAGLTKRDGARSQP